MLEKLFGFNPKETTVELTKNLVWSAEGKNDGFYAIPTLAVKWTF